MDDVLIVGGGVIGLSLAYELAANGMRVRLLDRAAAGREASWAGAGILPPGDRNTAEDANERLVGLSHELHPQWAQRLRDETGIDTGYRRTGGLHVARTSEDAELLRQSAKDLLRRRISLTELAPQSVCELEPALADEGATAAKFQAAFLLPDEGQIRNPRHLKALIKACRLRGVEIDEGVSVEDFSLADGRIVGVQTNVGRLVSETVCVCAGAWSKTLLNRLDVHIPLKPIRGQMALLASRRPSLRHIISEGPRYLVPRPDGRVLVGSTEEDVGFDKRTTSAGISALLRFALELAPGLRDAEVEQCWAGLRPGTADGLPYLGTIPGTSNGFIAAGHFRSGLQTSPGAAVVMSQLIRGERTEFDLHPFRLDRG